MLQPTTPVTTGMLSTPVRTIYKYPLQTSGITYLSMPHGTHVLSVQLQQGVPQLWVAQDLHATNYQLAVHPVLTGGNPPQGGIYIGTVQIDWFVVHYYIV